MPVYIYRIENKDNGIGPYQGGTGINHGRYIDMPDRHPRMYEDITDIEEDRRWFCGFKDMEALQNWFYKDYLEEVISADAYHLVIYNVEACDYHHGEKQSIFDKAHAMLVDTIELTDVLSLY